jgi:DHA1 family bicyclomycin/chloramphenicol resistance-like MFS transporter
MIKQSRASLIPILGVLSAIGPFSIDMYLPGFPDIAMHLNTTVSRVSLSLSSFFIGISAGQLLYGPLLDRFGRKKPLYVGLLVYLIAGGCALARSVEPHWLAPGAGMDGHGCRAPWCADLFDVKDNAKCSPSSCWWWAFLPSLRRLI